MNIECDSDEFCPDCQSSVFIRNDQFELICQNCGCVVDTIAFDQSTCCKKNGEIVFQSTPNTGFGTLIGKKQERQGQFARYQRLNFSIHNSTNRVSLNMLDRVEEAFRKLVSELLRSEDLSKNEFMDEFKRTIVKVPKFTLARRLNLFAAALFSILARNKNILINPLKICRVLNEKPKNYMVVYNTIKAYFPFAKKIATVEDYLRITIDKLQLPFSLYRETVEFLQTHPFPSITTSKMRVAVALATLVAQHHLKIKAYKIAAELQIAAGALYNKLRTFPVPAMKARAIGHLETAVRQIVAAVVPNVIKIEVSPCATQTVISKIASPVMETPIQNTISIMNSHSKMADSNHFTLEPIFPHKDAKFPHKKLASFTIRPEITGYMLTYLGGKRVQNPSKKAQKTKIISRIQSNITDRIYPKYIKHTMLDSTAINYARPFSPAILSEARNYRNSRHDT